jgi:predicted DCC family thiol-disulfide oxidoreductase YuxK
MQALPPIKTKSLNMVVFIDGWCAICKNFAKTIKSIDTLNLVQIKDIRQEIFEKTDIDIDRGLKVMASKTNAGKYYGFESLYQVIKRIPILWITLPLFVILKITRFGNIFYNEIAIKRKIIPIQCTDQCSLEQN